MDLEKTGRYIKELRTKLGLSQNELGEEVHVTRQAVSNWENGKTLPDSDVLMSLSKLFHVSIEDILTGGENEENLTLKLVDEHNKKANKLKKTIYLFTSIITILIISFLGYYFINNYNSIKVYKASGSSDSFRIRDGVVISTSTKTYFKLGNLEIKNHSEDITINKAKMYMKLGKKEKIIFESDVHDRLFANSEGYDELYKSQLMKNKNNLFLEITYNDTKKETIPLELKEDFKNDYIMVLEENSIIKKNLKSITDSQIKIAYEQEEKEFEKNSFLRNKEIMPISYPIEPQPKEISNTTPVETIEPVKEPVETNHEEEIIEPVINLSQEEPQPEEPIENENPEDPTESEKEEEPEINYEEIIEIIEQHGVEEMMAMNLQYTVEEEIIHISLFRNNIRIEVYNNETIETYSLSKSIIEYEKMISFNMMEKKTFSIDEELDEEKANIKNKMNNYLMLVYQEIE